MKFSEVLSMEQRSARFRGKRKRTEMENPESIAGPIASQPPVTLSPDLMMEQPRRRTVIWARSELFPDPPRFKSDLNQSVEENQLHIDDGPNMDKNLIKRAASREEDFLRDVRMLGLAVGEEKELIWKQIYCHKKFNKGITRVPSSEPNANRLSVIVSHRSKYGEENLDRYLTGLDFNDISSTGPSLLEAEIGIEELLNINDFNAQKSTFDMYNLYFVDDMPYAHCIGTFRNSFFSIWRTLPLGETVMGDYIKFCQDKTATLPNYWMGIAMKQTR